RVGPSQGAEPSAGTSDSAGHLRRRRRSPHPAAQQDGDMLAPAVASSGAVAADCPACGAAGQLRYRLATYDIHECLRCTTAFNASFTGGGGDEELFGRSYFEVQHKEAFAGSLRDYRADPSLPVFVRRLEQIEQLIGVGRVLDVGPGLGTFLRAARERGWDVQGVELSAYAAEFIRRTHRLPVYTGDLAEFECGTGRTFDLITFWDAIEHVMHPREVLASARRLLRPGGLIVIATDNFDCLVADIGVAMYRATGG